MCDFWSENKKNKIIERQIKIDKKTFRNEVKILLLGTEESGKSTFIEQIKIIHDSEYSLRDKQRFKSYIYNNIFIAMQTIINAMHSLSIKYENKKNVENSRLILSVSVDYQTSVLKSLDTTYLMAIKELWSDSGVQKCYNRRNEYHLSDSSKYYFEQIERIGSQEYVPTTQDILRVRVPTNGINEYTFNAGTYRFRNPVDVPTIKVRRFHIVDIDGQRSERKIWINCFSDMPFIIFFVALNEYDFIKFDDNNRENSMDKSIALFKQIITCFRESIVILMMNKKDLFEEKIIYSHLGDYFPEYSGPKRDPIKAREYILNMFAEISAERIIYFHFICATDTEDIRAVFDVVKNDIYNCYHCECGYDHSRFVFI